MNDEHRCEVARRQRGDPVAVDTLVHRRGVGVRQCRRGLVRRQDAVSTTRRARVETTLDLVSRRPARCRCVPVQRHVGTGYRGAQRLDTDEVRRSGGRDVLPVAQSGRGERRDAITDRGAVGRRRDGEGRHPTHGGGERGPVGTVVGALLDPVAIGRDERSTVGARRGSGPRERRLGAGDGGVRQRGRCGGRAVRGGADHRRGAGPRGADRGDSEVVLRVVRESGDSERTGRVVAADRVSRRGGGRVFESVTGDGEPPRRQRRGPREGDGCVTPGGRQCRRRARSRRWPGDALSGNGRRHDRSDARTGHVARCHPEQHLTARQRRSRSPTMLGGGGGRGQRRPRDAAVTTDLDPIRDGGRVSGGIGNSPRDGEIGARSGTHRSPVGVTDGHVVRHVGGQRRHRTGGGSRSDRNLGAIVRVAVRGAVHVHRVDDEGVRGPGGEAGHGIGPCRRIENVGQHRGRVAVRTTAEANAISHDRTSPVVDDVAPREGHPITGITGAQVRRGQRLRRRCDGDDRRDTRAVDVDGGHAELIRDSVAQTVQPSPRVFGGTVGDKLPRCTVVDTLLDSVHHRRADVAHVVLTEVAAVHATGPIQVHHLAVRRGGELHETSRHATGHRVDERARGSGSGCVHGRYPEHVPRISVSTVEEVVQSRRRERGVAGPDRAPVLGTRRDVGGAQFDQILGDRTAVVVRLRPRQRDGFITVDHAHVGGSVGGGEGGGDDRRVRAHTDCRHGGHPVLVRGSVHDAARGEGGGRRVHGQDGPVDTVGGLLHPIAIHVVSAIPGCGRPRESDGAIPGDGRQGPWLCRQLVRDEAHGSEIAIAHGRDRDDADHEIRTGQQTRDSVGGR